MHHRRLHFLHHEETGLRFLLGRHSPISFLLPRLILTCQVFPIISGLAWLGMLLGMLLSWIIDENSRHYDTMSERATIAYISNIGADRLQPLFITGCTLTAVFLDAAFIAERWLRHKGRLVPNSSKGEKALSILSLLFAAVGTVGLICLSIFKTGTHGRLHWVFLALFIIGYLISAIFLCWEYQRLQFSMLPPGLSPRFKL